MDHLGTVRVGGRLARADIPYDEKHPIIIPKSSQLVTLIIAHYHERVQHQGRTITHSALRCAGFFVHGLRGAISSFIKNCSFCARLRKQPVAPKMGDLPLCRVEQTPPFTYVGLDAFGPFLVTEGRQTRRSKSTKKVYGIIFICMYSRAVHIELVQYMETASFRNALNRFFALRGICKQIRSDCGSNFIGARAQLESAFSEASLRGIAESRGIEWITNPPWASNFGGSWERAIGSVRKILDASLLKLGARYLSMDELQTLFQEAASIINNTPLYEISSNPEDPLPITPAHLLTLKDVPNPTPPETYEDSDLFAYGQKRWRRIQVLADDFWLKWKSNYLQNLQARKKWYKERANLEEGSAVIIKQKYSRRNQWDIARVISTINSHDGVVRSCLVKTKKGTYLRPVNKLVPLCPET